MSNGIPTHNCLHCNCKHEIFNLLEKDELKLINESKSEVSYSEGELILKQGTPITHIVAITSGVVKVYLEGLSKRKLIIRYVGPRDFIGGPGAFVGQINHFSSVAVEDTTACLIPVDLFKRLVETNRKFSLGYLEFVCQKRIYSFDRFISLTQKQMYGRAADALLYYNKTVYPNRKEGFPLNRKDLGELTALNKDSAGRILNYFEDSGLIKITDNKVIILDAEKLQAISNKG